MKSSYKYIYSQVKGWKGNPGEYFEEEKKFHQMIFKTRKKKKTDGWMNKTERESTKRNVYTKNLFI